MGTNYYSTKQCEACGEDVRERHIGKLSVGWKFTFRKYEDINNIDELEEYLKNKNIRDEYGRKVTHPEFWRMVGMKQNERDETPLSEIIDGYVFIDREFS